MADSTSPTIPYIRGWHRLGEHTLAWLEPDGGWGLTNTGLVTDGKQAVLIDTLLDLPHTQRMLDALDHEIPDVKITTVVNTHAGPEHFWGNQLVSGAAITVSEGTARAMASESQGELLRTTLAGLSPQDLLGGYLLDRAARFDFGPLQLPAPDYVFTGTTDLQAGGAIAQAIDLGGAQSDGDTAVWFPGDRVLFAGDLLSSGVHPVMWTGSMPTWIEACRTMEALNPRLVVPGRGPVMDGPAIAAFREYLEYVQAETVQRFELGVPWQEAAAGLRFDRWPWAAPERVAAMVATIYRSLGGTAPSELTEVVTAMATMAGGAQRRPRIAPTPPAHLGETAARLLKIPRRDDAPLSGRLADAPPLNILTTLLRHPDLLEKWMPVAIQINDGLLPLADRELVILRVALRCGARYEWDQHAPVALSAGLSAADLQRMVRGPEDAGWSPRQAALLRCVDELHSSATVGDLTWQTLSEHYDERELIELLMLVGQYHQVAFVANACRVPTDSWAGPSSFPGVPAA